jgi:hypothetical protein
MAEICGFSGLRTLCNSPFGGDNLTRERDALAAARAPAHGPIGGKGIAMTLPGGGPDVAFANRVAVADDHGPERLP